MNGTRLPVDKIYQRCLRCVAFDAYLDHSTGWHHEQQQGSCFCGCSITCCTLYSYIFGQREQGEVQDTRYLIGDMITLRIGSTCFPILPRCVVACELYDPNGNRGLNEIFEVEKRPPRLTILHNHELWHEIKFDAPSRLACNLEAFPLVYWGFVRGTLHTTEFGTGTGTGTQRNSCSHTC